MKSSALLAGNEKTAYTGFAKTIQGYQYLVVANVQYKNGNLNLGPAHVYGAAAILAKANRTQVAVDSRMAST